MKRKLLFLATCVAILLSGIISAQTVDISPTQFSVNDTSPDEGQNIVLTLRIDNYGPSTATNIVINNILPAGFVYVSNDRGAAYNSGTNKWTIATLGSGANVKLNITAYPSSGTNGTNLTGTATVASVNQTESVTTNNSINISVPVNYPDIQITKTVSSDTAEEGELVTYTLKAKHLSTTTINATNVVVEDILSNSLTYVSDTSAGAYSTSTHFWSVGTLTPGQTKQITITARIKAGTSGTDINNVAQLSSLTQNDLNATNNKSNAEVFVLEANLIMTKTVDDTTPDEGQTVVFTLKVKNDGDANATNVLAKDVLPAGLTYISNSSGGSYNATTGVWNVGTLASGAQKQITISAKVNTGTAATTIKNVATIESFDQSDTNTSDNTSSVSLLVNGADLQVTKTVNKLNPAVGSNVVYTIVVKNKGFLKAQTVVIQDILPSPDLLYVSSTVSQGAAYNSSTGKWAVGDINSGASATMTITAQVTVAANGKLVTNTASVFSAVQPDSVTSNNSASASIGVGSADLALVKTVSAGPYDPLATVTYTIQVTNNSNTTNAFSTKVSDLIPKNLTYVSDNSASTSTTYTPSNGIWDAGTVNALSNKTLTITCAINANTGGLVITNSATASSIMNDSNAANNTDTASFQVRGSDLALTQTVDNEFPSELDLIVYTITLTNNGPLDASSINVLDQIPFSTDFVSYTASQGTYNGLTGNWDVGTVSNGSAVTLNITALVRLSGSFINTATITASNQSDAVSKNNTVSVKVSAKKTFEAGSAIIDMGVSAQTYNNGLIPYGLVYELSFNHLIPVYWVVKHNKTWANPSAKQDQVDLTVNGKNYKGGPFVIPAEYMAVAEPIINQWMLDYPGLLVDKNLPEFESPFYDYISSFPRAVLDDQNGDKVQSAFYDKAKVPSTFGRLGSPDDLTLCDDMYTMPHADPQNWSAGTVNTLLDFIENGGYFWAACHAVSAMEGLVDINGDGKLDLTMLSKNGLVPWKEHNDGTPAYSYNIQAGIFNGSETAGDPLMQFIGTMDGALQNGSEQIYLPKIEGWRDSTVLAITDNDHPDVVNGTYPTGPATALAYGRAFGNNSYGMVMYEGSHSIAGGSEAENVAAARVYGNFLFQAGIERRPDIKIDRVETVTLTDETLALNAQVSGIAPPFTLQWLDSCGGSFDDPSSASPNYSPNASIVGLEKCLLRLIVTDNCGRQNFSSFYVFVDRDSDDDGIRDSVDLDDDNDGIPDIIEENGDTLRDTDGDGVFDRLDIDADNDGILDIVEGGLTRAQINLFDTNNDGVIDDTFSFGPNGLIDDLEISSESGTVDYDGNGSQDDFANSDSDIYYDFQDIDADNDGIPDNVEAQPSIGYILPNISVNILGLSISYPNGITVVDTDGDGIPDYIDTDSDNDGKPDIQENGMANSSSAADMDKDGLNNAFETNGINDVIWDVNEDIEDPTNLIILPDIDGDLLSGGDLDYRDVFDGNPPALSTIDFDGVDDYIDSSLNISNFDEVTVMAWVKLDSGFSKDGYIVNFGNLSIIALDRKQVKVTVNDSEVYIPHSHELEKDVWAHLTLVFNNAAASEKLKVYFNGELVVTNNDACLASPLYASTNKFTIGAKASNHTKLFKGDIDEVRVFNMALTDDQLQKIIHQEIQEDAGNVSGAVIPKRIVDANSTSTIPWTTLKAYYPMTSILSSTTSDFSGNGHTANLHNITTVLEQTAPMPYTTKADGPMDVANTWVHGGKWNLEALSNTGSAIIKVNNNVTTNSTLKTLGLVIAPSKKITVQGDNLISNDWYFELNGTLDLLNDSQLVQGMQSDLVTSATGKVLRRQEGTSSVYRYNYWSSPIGEVGVIGLSNNNASINNVNNSTFKLNTIKDEVGMNMPFTSSYNQAVKISTYWLYTFKKGLTYWDWVSLSPNAPLTPGLGYTQKGTGNAGLEQQYIFEGKPNNGTILVDVIDRGGPGSVTSVSKTQYLLGNPYPSALDIHKFIDDNNGVISGTLQLWQQWGGNSHYLSEYEGGYAQVNKLGSCRAYQFVGLEGANTGDQNGTVAPSRFLPVGQGFVTEVVADGTVVFNNSQRIFVREADADGGYENGSSFFKSSDSKAKSTATAKKSNTDMQKMRLEFNSVVGPKTRRELLLGFSETTTDGYDYGYEALTGENSNNDFTLNLDGDNMNMQAYAPITSDKVVSLNFRSSGNNTFEIKATEFDNVDKNQAIYLRDNTTGEYFDLTTSKAYRFTSAQGKFNQRFEIVFQSKQQTLSAEEATFTENFIYFQNTTNTLYGKKLNTTIDKLAIVNMRGQTVLEFNNVSQESLSNGLKLSNISAGAYVAWFKAEAGQVITKKIIVR
ncbi:LamG-like jellyroll fold domain-containing protein [Mariniflexile sp. AS56]|uniref:LamG-like jellyroll fold domain-containing protein n=1 Tax=Mariniflexile sp. AS56 TaxID=3063957 RepID=UPI0026E9B57A|nr:LamG-like jellyroll fold domain-containing protein [Mariniflexile sp. AS56]MDO7171062.1 LamG-like jellyroll fold domain-containing protein [Mariniflexile sp. AS56]